MSPSTYFVFRCLVGETFRQALATRTFWLMLTVSGLCILFCLGVSVEGGQSLRPPGEIELYGGDNQPLTGPNPRPGHMTLAFGMVRLTLFRDAEAQVRFLQTFLAFWVAGTVGTLAAVIWTAGFLPAFLDPGSAAVLLAKPVPRWLLLTVKVGGVLAFVAFQEAVFFGGTWLALGLRTGVWPSPYLWSIPIFLIHFAVIYSFSVLMAVCTRSTVAAIFGSLAFWLACFAMNYGRHAVVALPYLEPQAAPFSASIRGLAEIGYWVLPKPADMTIVLDDALQGDSGHFDVRPGPVREVQRHGAFFPGLSLLSSMIFALGVLAVAARRFALTDY